MHIAVFLPAKGSSERIRDKNLVPLDGIPLFMVTLKKLIKCNFFDEVWLDSESDVIHKIAEECGYKCHHLYRDPLLATNDADGNMVFINEVMHTDADIVIQILCTSPFINISTIRRGLDILTTNLYYDSVVLVRKEKCYEWNELGPSYNHQHIPNSIDLPWSYHETMGLYMVRRETALKTGRRIGNTPYLLDASPLEAVDLNDPEDLPLAEAITAGMREKHRKKYTLLKHHLSSPMLSDIMDDLDIKCVIKSLKPNIENTKLIGHAFTLHLRQLMEKEDFTGIYNTLETYDFITSGDVIVVQNDMPDFAYFGELNTNMAVRAGACGAIIGGVTRDSNATRCMGFPIFAKGVSCTDVRKRATMASFGGKIDIDGVKIQRGDLIFADSEGVIVLPEKYEDKILAAALKAIGRERDIITSLLNSGNFSDLYKQFGGF